MILPNFIIKSLQNQNFEYFESDVRSKAKDIELFDSYPYPIDYSFNSRGFRDREWPNDINDLQNSIWCIGDSVTTGIAAPVTHNWVSVLENAINQRCINISLTASSNDWIFRKGIEVLTTIKPKTIIFQWSFIPRGESNNTMLSDEERVLHFQSDLSPENLWKGFKSKIDYIELIKNNTNIIYYFPPYWNVLLVKSYNELEQQWKSILGEQWGDCPYDIQSFNLLNDCILKELKHFKLYDIINESCEYRSKFLNLMNGLKYVELSEYQDRSRDGYHPDIITSNYVVNKILELL